MIRLQPAARPTRRFAVLCPGFAADRVRRQPWHVADGLGRGLAALGHEVTLFTDVTAPTPPAPYAMVAVSAITSRGRASTELAAALSRDRVNRVFLIVGAAGLARLRALDLGAPVSLVMASPRLRLSEILRLGPGPLWRERSLLALPLLNAALPGPLLRAGMRRSKAEEIIYLSAEARRRFVSLGLPAGRMLRPQVDSGVLSPPSRGRPFTIGYLGPPLVARGADLALEAFEAAAARGLDARLLLLLRPDCDEACLRHFHARVERSPQRQAIDCRVGMLAPAELREAIADCHAFLLPFRAPVSEVPLVVIEAALSGRPTIVLPAPGVDEIARALGGIVAASPADLPDALFVAAARSSVPPIDCAAWTDWPAAVAPLLDPADSALDRYRLIALAGVDGGGKTFLLSALRHRLEAAGTPQRHVWTRFRNYLSKPFLALARLTGHNRKEELDGVRIGYHDFARRPWLAWPFLCLQVVDSLLDIWWRYYRPRDRRTILADRCLYDTLVDLAVDTGLERVIFGRLGHWLVGLLPQPALAVVLNRSVAAIRADRPDVLLDRNFARRRALYRRLAAEFGLPVLENDATAELVLDRLERLAATP